MSIAEEYKFIFALLIFYGFMYLMFFYGGEYLFGVNVDQVLFDTPQETTGNIIIDGLAVIGSTIWNFFFVMFALPLQGDYWIISIINTAILGSMIYIFIRVIRGGG